MRILLALLVCFVLLHTECSALHASGGGGLSATDIQGTYTGVMVPIARELISDTLKAQAAAEALAGVEPDVANSLGVFLFVVPETGLATGNYLFFDAGEAFFGSINAVADAAKARILGVIAGPALTNGAGGGIEFLTPIAAVGSFETVVEGGGSFFTGSGSFASRLTGESIVDLRGFEPDASPNGFGFTVLARLTYAIDGFKQSDATEPLTITPPVTVGPPAPTPAPTP